jgi:hypothetical protein
MMKKICLIIGAAIGFCAGLYLGIHLSGGWRGVDETVVEKHAEEAGRSAVAPVINIDRGDLPLFLFLGAGAVGGFLGGYCFREVFGKKSKRFEV